MFLLFHTSTEPDRRLYLSPPSFSPSLLLTISSPSFTLQFHPLLGGSRRRMLFLKCPLPYAMYWFQLLSKEGALILNKLLCSRFNSHRSVLIWKPLQNYIPTIYNLCLSFSENKRVSNHCTVPNWPTCTTYDSLNC